MGIGECMYGPNAWLSRFQLLFGWTSPRSTVCFTAKWVCEHSLSTHKPITGYHIRLAFLIFKWTFHKPKVEKGIFGFIPFPSSLVTLKRYLHSSFLLKTSILWNEGCQRFRILGTFPSQAAIMEFLSFRSRPSAISACKKIAPIFSPPLTPHTTFVNYYFCLKRKRKRKGKRSAVSNAQLKWFILQSSMSISTKHRPAFSSYQKAQPGNGPARFTSTWLTNAYSVRSTAGYKNKLQVMKAFFKFHLTVILRLKGDGWKYGKNPLGQWNIQQILGQAMCCYYG